MMARLPRVLRGRLLRYTALSLLLHGALSLPWLAADRLLQTPQMVQPLALDVLGMLSERQLEQQSAKAAPAGAKPVPRKTEVPHRLAGSVVPVQAAVEPQPADVAPAPRRAPVPIDGADQQQVQQTIQPPETEATQVRRYVISMSKAIQSKLVYPPEARDAGYMGRPKIRFTVTEDGDILPGTLSIGSSSGYNLLDDSALRAALASAPFGKAPRRMEVVIAVSFTAT